MYCKINVPVYKLAVFLLGIYCIKHLPLNQVHCSLIIFMMYICSQIFVNMHFYVQCFHVQVAISVFAPMLVCISTCMCTVVSKDEMLQVL